MTVREESRGRVRIVTIDRPERRNAVDAPTATALADSFRGFETAEDESVAVLTGAGGNFCAGFDLQSMARGSGMRIEEEDDGPMGPTRMRLSKPVIAAVEGYAVAGGFELALWCDLRVAASDAIFGIFNRRFGVPLIDMGTIRLPRLIGNGRALDLILTGRPVPADEATQMGIVNRLVGAGTALDEAVALAEQLAAFPQSALRGDRLSAHEQWALSEEEAWANELRRGMEAIASGEAEAGARRFAEGAGRQGHAAG